MKTEEIQRTAKGRDPNEVSRALQDLTPLSCEIVDRRGRPVPLSAAGFVLRFGGRYRLRVQPPFPEDELERLRIVTPPDFITLEPELREVDEQGRSVRTIPFKVSRGWLSQLSRLNAGVPSGELDISYEFRPGILRAPPTFQCPIVAFPVWGAVLVAVVLGLFWVMMQRLLTDFLFPEHRAETMRLFLESLLRVDSWVWLISIAVPVWLLVTAINWLALYRRSRELASEFEQQYPCV
jgi:hypothetical protein